MGFLIFFLSPRSNCSLCNNYDNYYLQMRRSNAIRQKRHARPLMEEGCCVVTTVVGMTVYGHLSPAGSQLA